MTEWNLSLDKTGRDLLEAPVGSKQELNDVQITVGRIGNMTENEVYEAVSAPLMSNMPLESMGLREISHELDAHVFVHVLDDRR